MTSPETLELEAVDAALAGRYVAPEHAELADLALLLRDERVEPAPGWATHLDRRVEAGFPKRPRRRLQVPTWFGPVAAVAGLLLPVIVIAALAGGGTDDMGSEGGGGVSATSAQESAPSAGGGGEARSDSAAGEEAFREGDRAVAPDVDAKSLPPSAGGDPRSDRRSARRIERSATMRLAAPRREIDAVASRIANVTTSLGGFVDSSSITSTHGGNLELRVPSRRLDTAIERLSKLGTVRELSRESLDITSETVSARDRLQDARAERASLLRQLADAVTVNETESIRARLRIVSREIAAARGSLRKVTNRANFANVAVMLVAKRGDAADEDGQGAWTPADAFDDALRGLEIAAGVAVIAAAVALPLLMAWLLAWLAHRGVARRRRERALDLA